MDHVFTVLGRNLENPEQPLLLGDGDRRYRHGPLNGTTTPLDLFAAEWLFEARDLAA